MTTLVNEPVKVLAAFGEKRLAIKPLKLLWGNASYELGKIDFLHATKKGVERVYHFSMCTAGGEMYVKLAFYTYSLTWILEEVEDDASGMNEQNRSLGWR